MNKLFDFLVSGCWHKWETIETMPLTQNVFSDGKHLTTCKGTRYILKCKKCGEVEKRDII